MRRVIIFVLNLVLAVTALVLGILSLRRGEHQLAATIGVLYGVGVLGLLGVIGWRLTHPVVRSILQATDFDRSRRDKGGVP